MTRSQCRCFERNGISGFRFVWSLPQPLPRHRSASRTTDQVRFSYKFELISSRNVPPYGGQIRFAKPTTTRKQTPEKSLTCKSTLYGQIHRLTLHSRVFRRVCLFLSHRFSLGKVGVAMQSCVARRDSFIARGLWADKIVLIRRK